MVSDKLNVNKIFQVREIEKLAPKLNERINILGFKIVRVIMIESSKKTLQFMIERSDLTDITIKECAKLSRVISEILDAEDLIKEEDYEGQNYNAYKSRDPNFETIFKKRVKQIREDFPIPDQFNEPIL